jgi:hypothetical protein
MRTLASQLKAQSRHGGSAVDLDLSTPWAATRSSVPRYVAAAMHSLLVAVALGAGAGLYLSFHVIKSDLVNGVATWLEALR